MTDFEMLKAMLDRAGAWYEASRNRQFIRVGDMIIDGAEFEFDSAGKLVKVW